MAAVLTENKHWSSGDWQVGEGNADDFIDAWRDFLTWSKESADGFLGARLVRDLTDPNHFVSFATWRSADALRTWQEDPGFAKRFGACRALCDDMRSGVYQLTVDV